MPCATFACHVNSLSTTLNPSTMFNPPTCSLQPARCNPPLQTQGLVGSATLHVSVCSACTRGGVYIYILYIYIIYRDDSSRRPFAADRRPFAGRYGEYASSSGWCPDVHIGMEGTARSFLPAQPWEMKRMWCSTPEKTLEHHLQIHRRPLNTTDISRLDVWPRNPAGNMWSSTVMQLVLHQTVSSLILILVKGWEPEEIGPVLLVIEKML